MRDPVRTDISANHESAAVCRRGKTWTIRGVLRPAKHYWHRLFGLAKYFLYHKILFGITNTKFDISYCVFRESFLNDQYKIRKFLSRIGESRELFFLDIGRNHGFVFHYTMYYIMKADFPISVINYYGIDPSPLKFVYFNFHDYLSKKQIKINYNIIDRAIIFNNEPNTILKYGEKNFGNFHVLGSNFARNDADKQLEFECVDIIVETMQFSDVIEIIKKNTGSDAIIVKIDCKTRTEYMFMEILDMLSPRKTNYLISCERGGSSDRDVSRYANEDAYVLTASNAF